MTRQATKMAVEPDSKTESLDKSAPADVSEPMNQQEIAELAYELWQAGGCPDGSPEVDWFRAEQELQSRGIKTS